MCNCQKEKFIIRVFGNITVPVQHTDEGVQ